MARMKDLHRAERPREKLEKYGPAKLSDAELLAVLLRTGTRGQNVLEMSKKILKKFSDYGLARASLDDLKNTRGLGVAKACQIAACMELGGRIFKNKKASIIMSPRDAWENCKDIRDHKKEHFVVFYLDTRNQEIARDIVSVGTLNANLVHPREVFEPAVRNICAQVVVAHNHPSGNPEPSDDDMAVTKRLADAGRILGIEVLDHVILAKESFVSLKERGCI